MISYSSCNNNLFYESIFSAFEIDDSMNLLSFQSNQFKKKEEVCENCKLTFKNLMLHLFKKEECRQIYGESYEEMKSSRKRTTSQKRKFCQMQESSEESVSSFKKFY